MLNELVKYMQDKKALLKQDMVAIEFQMVNETGDLSLLNHRYESTADKIKLTSEYLSVARDILHSNNANER